MLHNHLGSGADPGFFLGGGAPVSCSTSTPINHIVFFFGRIPVVMRDCMDRRVTPPKGATSPTWGPPPPCKQALREPKDKIILYLALVKLALPESALQYLSFDQKQFHL